MHRNAVIPAYADVVAIDTYTVIGSTKRLTVAMTDVNVSVNQIST